MLLCHQQHAVADSAIQQCNMILQRQSDVAGELYDQIHKRKQIEEHDARIYAAEIVLMLDRLRQEKVSLLSLLIFCNVPSKLCKQFTSPSRCPCLHNTL